MITYWFVNNGAKRKPTIEVMAKTEIITQVMYARFFLFL